ncbi:MAG: chromate transporter [Chloroflexi bacterium]|nr:chromate transporter [Chloroflexota bacterium]
MSSEAGAVGEARATCVQAAQATPPSRPVPTPFQLYLAFFKIGICAFGGVGPWARRVIVEEEGWFDDREYAELLGLAQVLPGPNVGNVSVFIGDRFHGALGAALALGGLMTGPIVTLLLLGMGFDWLVSFPPIDGAVHGVAAAAAGLFIGTALKMADRLRLGLPALAILGCAFVGIGLLRLPLLPVIGVLAPISMLLAWRLRW